MSFAYFALIPTFILPYAPVTSRAANFAVSVSSLRQPSQAPITLSAGSSHFATPPPSLENRSLEITALCCIELYEHYISYNTTQQSMHGTDTERQRKIQWKKKIK